MNIEEIIYTGRNNEIIFSLSTNGNPINHSLITRCQVKVGATMIDSQTSPNLFSMVNADRIILALGLTTIPAGDYTAKLYIFDLDNIEGVAWGEFDVTVTS
jgi:hypothetical protein